MYTLCCTRFNTKTWNENKRWRENKNYIGCLYPCPVKVKSSICLLSSIIVIEMHNDFNKILGIGLINNIVHTNCVCNVYEDKRYNRYIYKSIYRIDEVDFTDIERISLKVLELLLFKGSRHCKRGQGITCLPLNIINMHDIDYIELIRGMFRFRFSNKEKIN